MIDAAGLRVMKAIADEGSFTAAAASLGYTQPAISQMVRRLEQRTGTVLVEIAGLRSGRVRLMAFPSASATLVPRALALVKQRFPDVSISFTEAEPPESLAALKAGECDLAVAFAYEGTDLGRGEEDLDAFVITPLLDDEVRLAVPEGHPVAEQETVDLADLADEPWIAGCPRCRGHLLQLTHDAGFRPDVAYETEDYVAVMGLIAEGLGVALIPDLILRTVHHSDVVALPITPASRRAIMAVTTPDLQRVPAVKATLDALAESAKGQSTAPTIRAPEPAFSI